jgi:hypothetical protein
MAERETNIVELFLGNGSLNTFPQEQTQREKGTATEERFFICGPCRDAINGAVWGNYIVARVLSCYSVKRSLRG